ncbi:MAG: NAD-dependent epimerase/dehydratase family protein [Patescibacteria group bacterium]
MSNFVVTGGAGFIGSKLAEYLKGQGHQVKVLDEFCPTWMSDSLKNKGIDLVLGSITSTDSLRIAFRDADGVFHLAAYSKMKKCAENPSIAYRINVGGTLNVLVTAVECGIKRVVYAASAQAYGDNPRLPWKENARVRPLNPYAQTKYLGEVLCKEMAGAKFIETVRLRYFNVFGADRALAGMTDPPCIIERFLRQKIEGKPIQIIGSGKQRRDFIHVDDVIKATALAIENKKISKGEIINIGSGKNHSVVEIAELVGGTTERLPGQKEENDWLADISKAKKILGWEPKISVEQWIKEQLAQL